MEDQVTWVVPAGRTDGTQQEQLMDQDIQRDRKDKKNEGGVDPVRCGQKTTGVGGGLDHAVLHGRPTVLLFSAFSSLFSTLFWAPGTPRGAWLTPAGAA